VHAIEDGDASLDVVVEFNLVFVIVRAEQAANILNDTSFERERESEEKRVELGPVEALTEIGARILEFGRRACQRRRDVLSSPCLREALAVDHRALPTFQRLSRCGQFAA